MISEQAFVHPNAEIGKNVTIDAFAYIDENVIIGDGTHIYPHATVLSGARIGKNCNIFPGAVISAIPQDLKFVGEETTAVIGDYTTIRECVTVNRGTASKGTTIVGNHCLIMAYAHVAHDCKLGDRIILGNTTQLAGEVVVDDWAIVSGGTLVHQFCHLGAHIMVQGGSKITKDIPPYMMVGREPLAYMGLNIVGLRRRGFVAEQMNAIQESYRYVYLSGLNTTQALDAIEKNIPKSKEREDIVSFIRSSERGIIK
jgi:UDP-N-acetylglucosamine acyltransferase